jgi:hypothetical protein
MKFNLLCKMAPQMSHCWHTSAECVSLKWRFSCCGVYSLPQMAQGPARKNSMM